MKLSAPAAKFTVLFISLAYILLFIYAAASKVKDFEQFRNQLGQSPLLSAFAGSVAIAVPVTEILISLLLAFPKLRIYGLYAAYTLMVMFTAYIYIILNYSAFVPCSCGGILEKMDWNEHLFFNLAFTPLGVLGIFLESYTPKTDRP